MDSETNQILIEYCSKCRFLMRAAWVAQELLQTFDEHLDQVALVPSNQAGIFEITLNDTLIWNRKMDGNMPDIKKIKQRIRDQIIPEKISGTPTHQKINHHENGDPAFYWTDFFSSRPLHHSEEIITTWVKGGKATWSVTAPSS